MGFRPISPFCERDGGRLRIHAGPQWVRPDGKTWTPIAKVARARKIVGGYAFEALGERVDLLIDSRDAAALAAATIAIGLYPLRAGPVLDPAKAPDVLRWRIVATPGVKRTAAGWRLGICDGVPFGLLLDDWIDLLGEKCVVNGDDITLDLTALKKLAKPINLDPVVAPLSNQTGYLKTEDTTGGYAWSDILAGNGETEDRAVGGTQVQTMASYVAATNTRICRRGFLTFDCTDVLGRIASGVFTFTPSALENAALCALNIYKIDDYETLDHAGDWPRTIGVWPNDVLLASIDATDLTVDTAYPLAIDAADIIAGGKFCVCCREKNADVGANQPPNATALTINLHGYGAGTGAYKPTLEVTLKARRMVGYSPHRNSPHRSLVGFSRAF